LKFIVSQIGAREHYAVARALRQNGRLDTLFTDFWAGPVLRATARWIPVGGLPSLAARGHPGLERAQRGAQGAAPEDRAAVRGPSSSRRPVVSWNLAALSWERRLRKRCARGDRYLGYLEVGRSFASAVRDKLRRRRDLSARTFFFAYDTGALETLEYLKAQGVRCVVDQMDPNRVEANLVCQEAGRWPGWAVASTVVPEEYFRRREQEWALADRVVVNSEFSRQALIQQGVPHEKLVVVPLCYELAAETPKLRIPESPLRVLFLGQVILRKGIQYLMAAARLLQNEPVRFDVVGPLGISPDAVKSAPSNLTFHGRANRDQAHAWYQQAGLFVLPTLSDGFALTQLEAMAHGLPVIATPNCGQVVTEGEDGFIVAPGDPAGLAHAIQRYLQEPQLLADHRMGAQKKAGQFTLARLEANLAALQAELVAAS
jgi:glycosyltransferase involved in cell wall biosynthesis